MPKKILAVDDEQLIVRLVEINLRRQGYEVISANNGRQALDLVAAEKPDIVIMDVMMPEMDGFEALRQMKANPETRDIPVIMLTAQSKDADIFEGMDRGADVYLLKPVSPQDLIKAVLEVAERLDKVSG